MLSAARTRFRTQVSTFTIDQYPFQRMLYGFGRLSTAPMPSGSSKVAQTRLHRPVASFSSRSEKVSGSGSRRGSQRQTTPKPKPAKPSHLASRPIFLKHVETRASRIPAWRRPPESAPTPEYAKRHRETLKKQFPEGWKPPHKISREAMEGIRAFHAHDPQRFTTPVLADSR